MQVASTRKVDANPVITMDVSLTGTRHCTFAMVASESVSVSDNLFNDVAGTCQIDIKIDDLAIKGGIRGTAHLKIKVKSIHSALDVGTARQIHIDFISHDVAKETGCT